MNIGLMLPAIFAIDSPGNGVRVQAWRQADALERLGHTVVRLDPWKYCDGARLDVVQFFMGGYAMHTIERMHPFTGRMLVFAPIIDSNQSFRAYRLAASAGNRLPQFATIPGEFRKQARGSRMVIVRSSHERDRVIRGLGADPARIEIVLNGVDPIRDADPGAARRTFDLPEAFVLHVSAYTQERKNVVRMVEAIGPTGLPLIIAGFALAGPVLDRLKALTEKFSNVRLLGYMDQSTLHSLYAACRVFCLPSSHEGTGLVALEAASLGARIVITRNGGPRDYFHEHAEYVDPTSTASIRDAVVRAWNSPASNALRVHVERNLTWDASAAAMVAAYQKHIPVS